MEKPPKYVREIMTKGVINIAKHEPVSEAVRLMSERNISCVVVTDDHDSSKPLGIITERDLIRRILAEQKDSKQVKAEEVMTSNVVSISEEADLEEAMRIIESMKIRRLPVVNEQGLVGLVTQTDIVKHTHKIQRHNERLTYHQNLQSYIIIAVAAFVVIMFAIKFFF